VAIDSNPATISSNGDGGGELFVTSGGNGYIYDKGADTFTQISALNGKATMGGQLDGYFLALDQSTAKLQVSDLLDGTTWDATQFAQRSTGSDPWIAKKVVGQYIWLFGSQTTEIWFNAGVAPFPFEPHPAGRLLPYGCAAAFSPVIAEGTLVWLGRSRSGEGIVLRATGFQPERISTFPVQSKLQSYAKISDTVGDSYNDQGHTFYLLSVPDAGITWAWDAQTQLWHERGTWISENNAFESWRPRFHAHEFNEHRWLDASSGEVYRSSPDLGSDVEGREIRRIRRAPAIIDQNRRIFYNSFELLMETGIGTQTTVGQRLPGALFADATFNAYWEFQSDGADEFGVSHLTANFTPTYATAVFKNGAQLTKVTDDTDSPHFSIAAGSADSFNPGTSDFVIAIKGIRDLENEQHTFMAKGQATSPTRSGYSVFASNNGRLTATLLDTAGTSAAVSVLSVLFADAKYHSVVVSVDRTADVMTVYVDGASIGTASTSTLGSIGDSGEPFYIGRSITAAGGRMYNGRVDQAVFLVGTTWSQAQVDTYHALIEAGSNNPQVALRMSDDGGRTWGPELYRSAGKAGEYSTRVHWERLGAARKRVFEVVMTDPVPWKLVDAYLDVSREREAMTPGPFAQAGSR
jgi:hypothetical protein